MSLSTLSVEIIDERYHIIEYGKFKVIAIYKTPYKDYINATKLCKHDDKDYYNWAANQTSQKLIDLLDNRLNPSPDILGDENSIAHATLLVKGGSNVDIRGTYVHPLLLPHILCWCSPEFALEVGEIVNNYFINEKDKKIFDLETLSKQLKAQHEESMKAHEITKDLLMQAHDDLSELHNKHDDTSNQIVRLTEGINQMRINELHSDQYSLPPINERHREILCIIRLKLIKGNKKRNVYLVNRCQRRTYLTNRKSMIRRLMYREPYNTYLKDANPIDILFLSTSPNPVSLWNRFRRTYENLFVVNGGIIEFYTTEWRIQRLIDELYIFTETEPLTINELQEQYEALLKVTDDSDDEI